MMIILCSRSYLKRKFGCRDYLNPVWCKCSLGMTELTFYELNTYSSVNISSV